MGFVLLFVAAPEHLVTDANRDTNFQYGIVCKATKSVAVQFLHLSVWTKEIMKGTCYAGLRPEAKVKELLAIFWTLEKTESASAIGGEDDNGRFAVDVVVRRRRFMMMMMTLIAIALVE